MERPDHISPIKGSGIYVYMRRVPKSVASVDKRGLIRKSLGTRDKLVALKMARAHDKANEEYWAGILQGLNPTDAWDRYESAQKIVKAMGFQSMSTQDLLTVPSRELVDRTALARQHLHDEPLVLHAALGGVEKPKHTFDDMVGTYKSHMSVALAKLSPNQLKVHINARERAVKSLKSILGAPPLDTITHDDVLKYRDHWSSRVLAGEVTADTASREFSNIKGMFTAIDEELKTTYGLVWKSLKIKRKGRKQKTRTRPPYPLDFVQSSLLRHGALDGLNEQARLIVYTMVETGLRLTEACNLRPQDIRLNDSIPHVIIEERPDREQKTSHSIRTIPLIGVSHWALKQAPGGFPNYHDKAGSASATINKFLKENKLRPTPKHSVYSLRHTFQDRMLAAGAPDRLQTDLMGHEFEREEYGAGASLKQKKALLDTIAFQWKPPA